MSRKPTSSSMEITRPRTLTWQPQSLPSNTVNATRGSRRMIRNRKRLSSMFNSTRSSSQSYQVATVWGAPSLRSDATTAAFGRRRNSSTSAGTGGCGIDKATDSCSRAGLLHRRVERDLRRREVRLAHERERVGRAPGAVHPAVLPFDREWALVADPVQRAEEGLEVDVAVAGRHEVPAARLIAEVQVRAENRPAAVEPLLRVLDVHVIDPVGEVERKLRRIEELMREVARVEVDAERVAVSDRVERLPRRDEVVRDLGRVHLQPELDALLVEDVHDRV